jgi:hypothetical protein
VNASADTDVKPAEVIAITDGGAPTHVDAADRKRANTGAHVDADDFEITTTRTHVDADDMEIAHVGAHVDASDVLGANTSTYVGAGSMKIVSAGAHVGASSKLDAAILRTQAKTALTGLGWKPTAPDVTLEQLIYASLRHCPGLEVHDNMLGLCVSLP